MKPREVPADLLDLAARTLQDEAYDCTDETCQLGEVECWEAHPINFSAMVAGTTRIDGSAPDVARVALAAVLPEHERQIRAKVAAEIRDLRDGVQKRDKPYNEAFIHALDCAIRAISRGGA